MDASTLDRLTTATPPQQAADDTSWLDAYTTPKPPEQPNQPSAAGSAARSFVRAAGPMEAGTAAGMATATALAPTAAVPVIGPAIPVVGGLIAGIGTTIATRWAQDKLADKFMPEGSMFRTDSAQKDFETNPKATVTGELFAGGTPNPMNAVRTVKTAAKLTTKSGRAGVRAAYGAMGKGAKGIEQWLAENTISAEEQAARVAALHGVQSTMSTVAGSAVQAGTGIVQGRGAGDVATEAALGALFTGRSPTHIARDMITPTAQTATTQPTQPTVDGSAPVGAQQTATQTPTTPTPPPPISTEPKVAMTPEEIMAVRTGQKRPSDGTTIAHADVDKRLVDAGLAPPEHTTAKWTEEGVKSEAAERMKDPTYAGRLADFIEANPGVRIDPVSAVVLNQHLKKQLDAFIKQRADLQAMPKDHPDRARAVAELEKSEAAAIAVAKITDTGGSLSGGELRARRMALAEEIFNNPFQAIATLEAKRGEPLTKEERDQIGVTFEAARKAEEALSDARRKAEEAADNLELESQKGEIAKAIQAVKASRSKKRDVMEAIAAALGREVSAPPPSLPTNTKQAKQAKPKRQAPQLTEREKAEVDYETKRKAAVKAAEDRAAEEYDKFVDDAANKIDHLPDAPTGMETGVMGFETEAPHPDDVAHNEQLNKAGRDAYIAEHGRQAGEEFDAANGDHPGHPDFGAHVFMDATGIMTAARVLHTMARQARDLASFSARAIAKFGNWVKPHLKALWEAAKRGANNVHEYLKGVAQAARKTSQQGGTSGRPGISKEQSDAGLFHYAVLQGHKGKADYADWHDLMQAEFPDKVLSKTEFYAAQKAYEAALVQYDKAPPPKKTPADIISKAKPGEEIPRSIVNALVRHYVEAGETTPEGLRAKVHKDLLEINPQQTERETGIAISGYGKVSIPNQAPLRKMERELKTLVRLQEALKDAKRNHPPERSGPQRDKPTKRVRDAEADLDKFLRDHPELRPRDPSKQLAGARDALITRLKNQIEDLTAVINGKSKKRQKGAGVPDDPEIEGLRKQRDELKAYVDDLTGTPDMTPEQRLKNAEEAAVRARNELAQKIMAANFAPKDNTGASSPYSRALSAAKLANLNMRKYLQYVRDLNKPYVSGDEKWAKNRLKQIEKQIKKIEAQNKAAEGGDKTAYDKPAKRERVIPPAMQKEINRLEGALILAKKKQAEEVHKIKLANRTTGERMKDLGKDIITFAREMMTTLDDSGVLRQGRFALGRPVLAAKAGMDSIMAMRSQQGMAELEARIAAHPDFPLAKRAKLAITDPNSHLFHKMEEAHQSRWARKIPILSHFGRLYASYLNSLRMHVFTQLVAEHRAKNAGQISEGAAKELASLVNMLTGRSNMGKYENLGVVLNTVLFAPKLVLSRLQIATGKGVLYGAKHGTRMAAAKEYARSAAVMAGVYALYSLLGGKGESDPRSSEFGKMRWGNTSVDPLGGLAQVATFLSRIITGETVKNGKVQGLRPGQRPLNLFRDRPLHDKTKFGQDALNTTTQFIRSKASPIAGLAVDLGTGKDYNGKPLDFGMNANNRILQMFKPMPVSDYSDLWGKSDMSTEGKAAASGMMFFGEGVRVYTPKPPRRH